MRIKLRLLSATPENDRRSVIKSKLWVNEVVRVWEEKPHEFKVFLPDGLHEHGLNNLTALINACVDFAIHSKQFPQVPTHFTGGPVARGSDRGQL